MSVDMSEDVPSTILGCVLDVSGSMREALDLGESVWIGKRFRLDRYRAGGLASSYSRCRGLCDDNVYLLLYQLRREAKQSVEVAVCIAKFDGNVSALDVAEVFKALAKGLTVLGVEA